MQHKVKSWIQNSLKPSPADCNLQLIWWRDLWRKETGTVVSGTTEPMHSPAEQTLAYRMFTRDKCTKSFQSDTSVRKQGTTHALTCSNHLWSCPTPLLWELSSTWLHLPLELPVRPHLQWSPASLSRWKQNRSDLEAGSENTLYTYVKEWYIQKCTTEKTSFLWSKDKQ